MLQLQTKTIDICRISKLLVKYKVKASITDSVITLDGDVSNDLLTQLCGSISINSVQNFIGQEPYNASAENSIIESEEISKNKPDKKLESNPSPELANTSELEEAQESIETPQETPTLPCSLPQYDLIYKDVKRGEVYMCDFGEPYGHEQGFERYSIVVQNDVGNLYSPTTIVIPCTTQTKSWNAVHYYTIFSSENMVDYDSQRVGNQTNIILSEQIRIVDKTRLRKYIGTLTPEFMAILQNKIDVSLSLNREPKIIVEEKTVYVDRPVPQESKVNSKSTKGHPTDLNVVQIQLLSFVDINELLKISESNSSDEVKAKKILELFGFDLQRNGVQYLLKAIILSPKDAYFNLETLSKHVSREESIDEEEIKRLIIARVKETFAFRKAPTIDFIRLVNSFLVKREVNYEKTNI